MRSALCLEGSCDLCMVSLFADDLPQIGLGTTTRTRGIPVLGTGREQDDLFRRRLSAAPNNPLAMLLTLGNFWTPTGALYGLVFCDQICMRRFCMLRGRTHADFQLASTQNFFRKPKRDRAPVSLRLNKPYNFRTSYMRTSRV